MGCLVRDGAHKTGDSRVDSVALRRQQGVVYAVPLESQEHADSVYTNQSIVQGHGRDLLLQDQGRRVPLLGLVEPRQEFILECAAVKG